MRLNLIINPRFVEIFNEAERTGWKRLNYKELQHK